MSRSSTYAGHLEVNVSSSPVDDIFRTGFSDVVTLDVHSSLLRTSKATTSEQPVLKMSSTGDDETLTSRCPGVSTRLGHTSHSGPRPSSPEVDNGINIAGRESLSQYISDFYLLNFIPLKQPLHLYCYNITVYNNIMLYYMFRLMMWPSSDKSSSSEFSAQGQVLHCKCGNLGCSFTSD